MIYTTLVTSGTLASSGTLVFTSSSTGAPVAGLVVGQRRAVTTIAFCNIDTTAGALTDETVGDANINVYIRSAEQGLGITSCAVVSNLNIPQGETVFFSEERLVLEAGDEIYVSSDTANIINVTVSSIEV